MAKNNSPPDSRDFFLPAVTEGAVAAAAASSRTSTAAWSILAASYLAVHMSHTSTRMRSQTQFTCTFMEMYVGCFFFSQFPSRLFDQFRGSTLSLLLGMWIDGGRGSRRLNGKYWRLYILMQTEPPAGVGFKGLARLNFTHFPIS